MAATTRARKSKKTTTDGTAVVPDKAPYRALREAVQFAALAQDTAGEPYRTHCVLWNGWIYATNGVIGAGCPIDTPIQACPHTTTLLAALDKCQDGASITQTDITTLLVRAGKLTAKVPCISTEQCIYAAPDAPVVAIGDVLKEGFKAVGSLAQEGAQRVMLMSVLLRDNSVVATNGSALLEFWHGIRIGAALAVPKAFVTKLCTVGKSITHIGYSTGSLTVYFTDQSWLKTQLYTDAWPDVDKLLNFTPNTEELPKFFFEAVDTLLPFVGNVPRITIEHALMQVLEETASYEMPADLFAEKRCFDPKLLKLVQHGMQHVDFREQHQSAFFINGNIRGLISPCRTD